MLETFYSKCVVCVLQIDEEVAKLLELKARLGGDDGKHQFVLKAAKVRAQCCCIKHTRLNGKFKKAVC